MQAYFDLALPAYLSQWSMRRSWRAGWEDAISTLPTRNGRHAGPVARLAGLRGGGGLHLRGGWPRAWRATSAAISSAKVNRFSNAEFDRFSTASLVTRSTNDVTQVQLVTMMLIRIVFYAPIIAVGGILRLAAQEFRHVGG